MIPVMFAKNSYSGDTINNCTICMKEAGLVSFFGFKNCNFTKGMWRKNTGKSLPAMKEKGRPQ